MTNSLGMELPLAERRESRSGLEEVLANREGGTGGVCPGVSPLHRAQPQP